MSEEYTEEQIASMKMKAALEASEELPLDVFSAVPDEDIVTLEVSGQFGRVLNRVLEYLYQCEKDEEVIRSAKLVANNFEGLNQQDIGMHAIALWAVSNLLANFSMNAGTQNKTKIYDKDKIMTHIFGGVKNPEPLVPLTPEEFEERKAAHAEKLRNQAPLAEGKEKPSRADSMVNHTDNTVKQTKDLREKTRNLKKNYNKINRTTEEEAKKLARIEERNRYRKNNDGKLPPIKDED